MKATRLSVGQRMQRKLPRLRKAGQFWIRALAAARRPQTRLVFVVGSQRSGTRLPLEVLDRAPDVATYSEGTAPYFDDVLLQPLDRIEELVRRSPAPIVALKPICETHRINELLDRFPGSKAIWIFRHYEDAVNSASLKWSSGREAVRRLAMGDLTAGWRAGGLSRERRELVSRLYRPEMSLHEANAIMWFLRNGLFFDLGASRRPEVLLVRYEDLVSRPSEGFARLFDFIGARVPSGLEGVVRHGRQSNRPFPEIACEVRTRCEQLHARLLAHYSARLTAPAPRGLAEAL